MHLTTGLLANDTFLLLTGVLDMEAASEREDMRGHCSRRNRFLQLASVPRVRGYDVTVRQKKEKRMSLKGKESAAYVLDKVH